MPASPRRISEPRQNTNNRPARSSLHHPCWRWPCQRCRTSSASPCCFKGQQRAYRSIVDQLSGCGVVGGAGCSARDMARDVRMSLTAWGRWRLRPPSCDARDRHQGPVHQRPAGADRRTGVGARRLMPGLEAPGGTVVQGQSQRDSARSARSERTGPRLCRSGRCRQRSATLTMNETGVLTGFTETGAAGVVALFGPKSSHRRPEEIIPLTEPLAGSFDRL